MARPLRIQSPGLWHHVMSRGLAHRPVFVEPADREDFLGLLTVARERWGLRTHAACLMDNHYHLLVEDTRGELSRAMRHVVGVYTQRFNARQGRDGPLFRGRFRSRLVQTERYLAELVRYIHMNPVQAGLVARAGDHPWSSHGHYLRGETPDWLVTDEVLGRFGGDPEALDRFVHQRVPPEEEATLGWGEHPEALGDEGFMARWEKRRDELERGRARVRARRAHTARRCEEVLAAVSAQFDVPLDELRRGRRGNASIARKTALLVCVDHTPQSAPKVGAALGVQPRTVSVLACRYRRRLVEDKAFRAQVQGVLNRLRADPDPPLSSP